MIDNYLVSVNNKHKPRSDARRTDRFASFKEVQEGI